MPDHADALTPPKPSPPWVWPAVIFLLALYAGLAFSASLQKGVSFDETEQLGVGYDIWLHHDFRMESANGDFVKRWATLPFLITQPTLPGIDKLTWIRANPYEFGYQFLFKSGNIPENLLLQARLMIVLLGLATGWLVFCCSREIFGPIGGLLSLTLFAFSPHMLAYGGLVSTEMSLCLTLLGATWSLWRILHRITWARLLASLFFLALLFLSKMSAFVIFPIAALLLAAKLLSRRPLEWRLGRPRTIASRPAQAGIFFALFLIHGLVCWTALWADYDFRYAANPNPADPAILSWIPTNHAPLTPRWRQLLSWSRGAHLLPEGYLDGIEVLLVERPVRLSFMDGQWELGGSLAFFPYAIWAKTSPFLFLFLLLAAACGGCAWLQNYLRARQNPPPPAPARAAPLFYDALPYLALVAVFLAVAVAQNLNIGHRHILPIYPAIDILLGGSVGLVWLSRQRLIKGLITLLILGYAGESLATYPNYLAYFNPAVGGSSQGYKHLVDSSLDWGMDLPDLKYWLDLNNPHNRQPLYLAYFGTDDPTHYGINARWISSYPEWYGQTMKSLDPGIYAISATLFESLYTNTEGPWNRTYETDYQNYRYNLRVYTSTLNDPARNASLLKKYPYPFWVDASNNFATLRFGRLCAWLRHHREPTDNIDHSILIWKLSRADIVAALGGPPAELADAPIWDNRPIASLQDHDNWPKTGCRVPTRPPHTESRHRH